MTRKKRRLYMLGLALLGLGTATALALTAFEDNLVFFYSPVSHVGIYVGDGKMIAAPQAGETVKVQDVGRPTAIRRVLPQTAAAPALSPRFSAASCYGSPASFPTN